MNRFVFILSSLVIVFSMFFSHVHSEQMQESRLTLSLPVNAMSTPKVHLKVTAPENYQPIQDIQSFSEPESPILEFIPKDESPTNRSRIFTAHKIIGAKLSASRLIEIFKDGFKKADPNMKVLEENVQKHDNYEEAYLAMQYHDGGRTEVVYMKYFSGPYDTAGAQAAMVVGQGETVPGALNVCKKLVDSSLEVVTF